MSDNKKIQIRFDGLSSRVGEWKEGEDGEDDPREIGRLRAELDKHRWIKRSERLPTEAVDGIPTICGRHMGIQAWDTLTRASVPMTVDAFCDITFIDPDRYAHWQPTTGPLMIENLELEQEGIS